MSQACTRSGLRKSEKTSTHKSDFASDFAIAFSVAQSKMPLKMALLVAVVFYSVLFMAEGPTILGSESRSFTFSQYYSIKTNRSTSTRCKVVMDVMVFYKSRLRIKEILYGQLLVTTGLEQGRLKLLVADWAAQLNTFEQKMLPCKSKCLLCKLDSFSLFSMFTSYIFTLSRSKETHLQGFFRRLDVSVTGLKSHLMSAQHVEDFVKPLPLKLLVAHL